MKSLSAGDEDMEPENLPRTRCTPEPTTTLGGASKPWPARIMAMCGLVAFCLVMSTLAVPRSIAQVSGPAGNPSSDASVQKRTSLRFLTEAAFPPFNFYDEDGILTGFNVDLARAICLELNVTCDIKAQPWDKLIPAVQRGETDAVVAAHAVTPASVAKVAFTDPYFRTPGRFATRRDAASFDATPEGLEGRRVGIIKGSVHEAFIRRFFPGSRIVSFADSDAARESLKQRRIDALFGDGISMAFWLNGTLSQQCCAFRGGPYLEPMFFGDGIAIAVRQGNSKLRTELNEALEAVRESGRFQELVSRYFPFQIY
ncbi:MAG: transporter substrate-binding domain-containing protein [Pseudomonadota bacterium]